MELTIFTANVKGNEKNCIYPNECIISNAKELKDAVSFDHVCGDFKERRRSANNFLSSDVIVMDCDNDTEDEAKWITKEKINDLITEINYALVPSRHNMKEKDGKKARPKFHIYFPITKIDSASEYANLKKQIQSKFPFFDDNALDAARFIYAVDVSCEDIEWNEGFFDICDVLDELPSYDGESFVGSRTIEIGARNKTLSHFAGKVLKRYGDSEKAHQIFLEEAEKCSEPLAEEELNTIWNSARKFFESIKNQEGYVEPSKYNADFEEGILKPKDFSDVGQAVVLAREYKDKLCYSTATDFLVFNGSYWEESAPKAQGVSQELTERQLKEAKGQVKSLQEKMKQSGMFEIILQVGLKKAPEFFNDEQMKIFNAYKDALEYMKYAVKRRDSKYIASSLKEVRPMLEISISDLDKDEFLINTPKFIYDLREGVKNARASNPSDFITKETLCDPGDNGKELWLDAIKTFFCNDESLISYVQDIVGLVAIGKVNLESIIIAYGEGRNGKSTFWNSISRVLGTYSGMLSADALTAGCRRNVKPEVAELKGKRLIIAAELEEGMRLNTSVIKQLCSTDEITAEKKYKDPFKFNPSHTLVLYTNHLPKVGANDAGTWRRVIVIPFNAKIEGKSDIKNYTDYLVNNAGPFIMKWIIEGAEKVIKKNYMLTMPSCVKEAVENYKSNNDWLGNFIDECCEVDKTYVQKSGEFYQEYRNYCIRMGEYVRSTTDFYTAIDNAGYRRHKKKSGNFIYGIRLKLDEFIS